MLNKLNKINLFLIFMAFLLPNLNGVGSLTRNKEGLRSESLIDGLVEFYYQNELPVGKSIKIEDALRRCYERAGIKLPKKSEAGKTESVREKRPIEQDTLQWLEKFERQYPDNKKLESIIYKPKPVDYKGIAKGAWRFGKKAALIISVLQILTVPIVIDWCDRIYQNDLSIIDRQIQHLARNGVEAISLNQVRINEEELAIKIRDRRFKLWIIRPTVVCLIIVLTFFINWAIKQNKNRRLKALLDELSWELVDLSFSDFEVRVVSDDPEINKQLEKTFGYFLPEKARQELLGYDVARKRNEIKAIFGKVCKNLYDQKTI